MGYKGIDLLGLPLCDVDMIATTIEPGTAIGALMGTFGNPVPALRKLLRTGKVPAVRIHLSSGTCERANVCEWQNEIRATDYTSLAKRAQVVRDLANEFPSVKFVVSPRLEHDVKDRKVVDKWINVLRTVSSTYEICVSAFTGYVPPNVLVERHGNHATGDITSNDGESLSDAPISYLSSGRLITFGWLHSFNGRGPGDDHFVPPSQRKRGWFASIDDIKYCNKWLRTPEPVPPVSIPLIQAPEILKPYAEYYSEHDDVREKKPMYISKTKVIGFDILTVGGTKVASAKRFAGDYHGMARYYVGSGSGDSSVSLMKKLGSEWSIWKSGNKKFLVNILRRQGAGR